MTLRDQPARRQLVSTATMTVPMPFYEKLAFDSTLGSYIEFPTPSDAMIASLCLAHGVDLKTMDAIFDVVRNTNFDPKELNFLGTEDVYLHAAKRRCRRAVYLTNRGFCSQATSGGFPQAILDGVTDVIGDEIECVSRWSLNGNGVSDNGSGSVKRVGELRKDLLNMSLVRRSWLIPARRALGRCVELNNPSRKVAMEFLRQPIYGPWTRQLSVVALEDYDATGLIRPLKKALLERLTSVSSMSLTVRSCDAIAFSELFHVIPMVRDFKLEICPHARDYLPIPDALFSSFAFLPRLRSLSLRLYNWSPSGLSAISLPMELLPITHLPDLCSVHILAYTTSERLSWTRGADDVFHLHTVEKNLGRRGRPTHEHPFATLESVAPLLVHVTSLLLRSPESGNVVLPQLLPCSNTLRRLCVTSDEFPSPAVFTSIPSSTGELTIGFSMDLRKYPDTEHEPWEMFDRRLLAYLETDQTKNLWSLHVCMCSENEGFLVRTRSGYRFRVLQDIKLPKSECYCKERGIEWKFTHGMDRLRGHWFD
ncbi:uncharacterized protein FOMMEDRAFT_18616 [Fomitiporia mediterranea MF3/22]|uniref:uncharacterized protein n=1 Tax=Fomitiporia mediterranea (strain MF3/22) TaxID=694068 RepID=UPI000440992D|nr:uncharacterized protein FOMMEDRAFT_18616 [Fomitiporia mediterranea MF3/22]EJD04898.1 hypothetical protein FOMMEDRAFT_18616 [Fomitiporia mediterranea MF3/22]